MGDEIMCVVEIAASVASNLFAQAASIATWPIPAYPRDGGAATAGAFHSNRTARFNRLVAEAGRFLLVGDRAGPANF